MLLLTGANGQVGTALLQRLPDAFCPPSDILDIGCPQSVEQYLSQHKVTTIINCAAYTAVDAAEDDTATAFRINAQGAENLARMGIPIIHLSTDYVFDGMTSHPYVESDQANPQSVYGQSKRDGENAVLQHASSGIIIRTSWVHSETRHNFVKTMHKLGQERESVSVVCDQIGTPTYAGDLADAILALLPHLPQHGTEIYNFSNEGVCSWYDFAYTIMQKCGLSCQVKPIESKDYAAKAARPAYCVLNKTKFKEKTGMTIPHWTQGLEKCLKQFS